MVCTQKCESIDPKIPSTAQKLGVHGWFAYQYTRASTPNHVSRHQKVELAESLHSKEHEVLPQTTNLCTKRVS